MIFCFYLSCKCEDGLFSYDPVPAFSPFRYRDILQPVPPFVNHFTYYSKEMLIISAFPLKPPAGCTRICKEAASQPNPAHAKHFCRCFPKSATLLSRFYLAAFPVEKVDMGRQDLLRQEGLIHRYNDQIQSVQICLFVQWHQQKFMNRRRDDHQI